MPSISFPSSPSTDDEYTFAGKTWIFNGIGWVVGTPVSVYEFLFPGVSRIWADETPELMAHEFVMTLIEKDYV